MAVCGNGSARASARLSLDGLSIGDAFGAVLGEQQPTPHTSACLAAKQPPPGPWPYTDDTEMALSIFALLRAEQDLDTDALALSFARRCEPERGYSPSTLRLLQRVRGGEPWRQLCRESFDGNGSYGNGAAMRVAPLGAFHAGNLSRALEQARLQAEITHAHPEAIAGAQAVAAAAALAANRQVESATPPEFLLTIANLLPTSAVRDGIEHAAALNGVPPVEAGQRLGCGERVSAQDTVPYALWCAAWNRQDYVQALWWAAEPGGDRDTLCAIAGGIVTAGAGEGCIPEAFLAARGSLPAWAFEEAP
jgi:ADP-ribosylglycohydrolase